MYDSADLNAFRTLVGSCCPVWHWVIGPDFQLLESDCPASPPPWPFPGRRCFTTA